ncbi:MAG: FHA domain-containing protein, partial [Planctomycetota bacterium]
MTPSYSLRFETGERHGEVVPMTGSTFCIGRKADNDLQIVENSVSGRHAELRLDDEGAVLVDMGSTNGTRVGNDRILEMRIRPGARLTLGNVGLTFLAGTPVSAPPAVPQAPAAGRETGDDMLAALESTVEQSSGALLEVSEEDLARARVGRGSRLGSLLLVALVVAGGGAWWWTQRGGGGSRRRTRPVVQVAGNLLGSDFSFEEGDHWKSAESATSSFLRNARSRFSGEMGLGVSLGPGEDALHLSPWVAVRAGTRLVATCELRAPGAAQGSIGIELLPASLVDGEDDRRGMRGWSAPVSEEPAFQSMQVVASVPPGYSRARVLLAGEAAPQAVGGADSESGGRVDFDDARLVAGGDGEPAASLEEYRLYPLGRAFSLLK